MRALCWCLACAQWWWYVLCHSIILFLSFFFFFGYKLCVGGGKVASGQCWGMPMVDESDLPWTTVQQESIPGLLSQGCLFLPVEPTFIGFFKWHIIWILPDAILLKMPFYRILFKDLPVYRFSFLWFLFFLKYRFEKARVS